MTIRLEVLASEGMGVVPLPPRSEGWVITSLGLRPGDTFAVRFERRGTPDWIEVEVAPRGDHGKAFQVLDHCVLRYRGSLSSKDAALREQVLSLVSGVGATVEARLATSPDAGIAEVLGRRHEPSKLVFSRDALRSLLAPTIVDGVPVLDGWTLTDVYPSSYAREVAGERLELVLDFRRAADGRRAMLMVSPRDDERPSFSQTANFSLSYLALGGAEPDGAESLRALVAFALELRDHEGLSVTFPEASADVAPALLPAKGADEPPRAEWLNLAISAECQQSCSFCSIKEMSPPADGGDALFARLSADLAAARGRGVEGVRINGYDPLAYSRIREVIEHATYLGFTRAHVFSPCTLLADLDFCAAIVHALPQERQFFVPLYGVTAARHDAIVGRPGAHALVMQAIDHLVDLAGARSVALLAVVTTENVEEMPSLAKLAGDRHLSFSAHMPYPSAESRADRYFACVPRQTDVATAFASSADAARRFPVYGVAPCVTFRAMRGAGVPVHAWLDAPDERPLLPGTEYKQSSFTHGAGRRESAAFVSTAVPCPHEGRCALSLACPGEILRAYVEKHGAEEFSAVSLRELVDAR